MGDLNPADLGGCQNPACDKGCGYFFPESTSGPLAIAHCVVCNCFGAQHVKKGHSASQSQASSAGFRPDLQFPPQGSATASTIFGSRPAGSGSSVPTPPVEKAPEVPKNQPGPFRMHAQARSESMMGSEQAEKKAPFNPAEAAWKAHDLQQDTSNARRKRKRDEQKAKGKGKMGEDKRPKKEVIKEYTIILVEHTSSVDSGRYRKPNADKLLNLRESNLVQKVNLSQSADNATIIRSINEAFPANIKLYLDGWRLLRVKVATTSMGTPKKGAPATLQPLVFDGDIDMDKWRTCRTNANVRGTASAFKNPVFIALSRCSPNLPLKGAAVEDSDVTVDSSSGEISDIENNGENFPRDQSHSDDEGQWEHDRKAKEKDKDGGKVPLFYPSTDENIPECEQNSPQPAPMNDEGVHKRTPQEHEESDSPQPMAENGEGDHKGTPTEREETFYTFYDDEEKSPFQQKYKAPDAHNAGLRLLKNMTKPVHSSQAFLNMLRCQVNSSGLEMAKDYCRSHKRMVQSDLCNNFV